MSRDFWVSVVVRAVKTFAQVAVATIVASQVTGLLDVDAANVASVAGLAAVLSVLTSVVAYNVPGLPTADPIGVLADSRKPADAPTGEDITFAGDSLPLDDSGE